MIGRLIDKLIFGVALLFSLQMPLLVDHYHQYLAGWYKATKWQVDGYQATAKAHEYADANAMITHHLNNAEPSVRADAQQKLATIELLAQLNTGIQTFTNGHLLEKMMFMLHPPKGVCAQGCGAEFQSGYSAEPKRPAVWCDIWFDTQSADFITFQTDELGTAVKTASTTA